jgi:hypothetical protein
LEPTKKLDWNFTLGLKTNFDVHVFIHPPGDEIWLSFLAFPEDMAYFKLDVNNSDGISTTDIIVSENEIISLDKTNAPCKSYTDKVKFITN